MSELRSVGVKGSAALYLWLLQEVCKTHLLDVPVHKSSSCLQGIIFTLLISSGVSSTGHTECFFTCELSWLQIRKRPFFSLLTCIPALLTSQMTGLVRAV